MQCQVETAFANINFQLDSVGNFFSALNSDIIWERFFWVMVLVLSVFFFFSFLIATYIDLSPRLTIPSPHSLGFTTSSYHLKGDQKLPPVPSLSP